MAVDKNINATLSFLREVAEIAELLRHPDTPKPGGNVDLRNLVATSIEQDLQSIYIIEWRRGREEYQPRRVMVLADLPQLEVSMIQEAMTLVPSTFPDDYMVVHEADAAGRALFSVQLKMQRFDVPAVREVLRARPYTPIK